ncbi:hypothetical protein HRbin01_00428 [archaeon HR01]|nr:hypothetical protein HRbin01_00428 [archaeon HR01]
MADGFLLELEAPLSCTEDPEKVLKAVSNIFPGLNLEKTEDSVKGKTDELRALDRVRMQLRSRRIRLSARALMEKGLTASSLVFYLDRQAAYAGRVAIWDPSDRYSISPIIVKISGSKTEEILEWLTGTGP